MEQQIPVCWREGPPPRRRGQGTRGDSISGDPSGFADLGGGDVRQRVEATWDWLSSGNPELRSGHRTATCTASAHWRVGLESSLESWAVSEVCERRCYLCPLESDGGDGGQRRRKEVGRGRLCGLLLGSRVRRGGKGFC